MTLRLSLLAWLAVALLCCSVGSRATVAPLHDLAWCKATFICTRESHPVVGYYGMFLNENGYACMCTAKDGVCAGINGEAYCVSAFLPNCESQFIAETEAATAGGTYGYCQRCAFGYQLSNYPNESPSCFPCQAVDQACMMCSSPGVCTQCYGGFTLSPSTNKCLNCPIEGCAGCSDHDVCGSCKPGYVLSADKRSCLRCDDAHCELCSSTSTCERCADGYTLSSDKRHCFECGVGGCSSCSADGVCAGCEAGLTLAADQRSCFTCALDGCATCAHTDVCGACAPGYVLSDGGLCGVCDVARCAQCISPGDGHRCATCTKGYKTDKKSGECVAGGVAWWVWLLVAVTAVLIAALAAALVYWLFCRCRRGAVALHAEEQHVLMLQKTAPVHSIDMEGDKEPETISLDAPSSQRRRRVSIGGETVLGANSPAVPQFTHFHTDASLSADDESGRQAWRSDFQPASLLSNPLSPPADDSSLFDSCDS